MDLNVRLFAGLRDRAGSDHVTVTLPDGATAADLVAAMDLPSRSCIVAVNREYVAPGQVLSEADEVALIPPVSGGAGMVRITPDPLDASAIRDRVTDPRAGAVIVFEGVTREVSHLDYEAYAEMAEPVLARICEEERERHGLCAVALEHKVGRVALSEPSVVVAVSAPHRVEAFAGAAAIMDRLKAEAPVWKLEDGEWVQGALPPQPGPPAS
jgi:molybdopterin synthase catalytic subunit